MKKNESKKREVVHIPNKKELSKFILKMYIIDDYMGSIDSYKDFQDSIYTILKGCYEYQECREYPVKFKFYKEDTEIHTLELRHFIINIFLWYPFVHLYGIKILDKSFILDCYKDIPNITDYINKKIIAILRDYTIKNTITNTSISDVLYNLRTITIDFSSVLNMNLSTEHFMEIYRSSPRMKEIMETAFPLEMQPSEIEASLDALMNEEIELIKEIENNPVSIILNSGTGIKHKQLCEFTVNQGLKPDLSGVTIPIPINSSTLIKGLDKPSYHYIDALGARKSLIMNKKVMGKAGYFGKICLLLARTLQLSKTVDNCNTKHLVKIEIKSRKMLEKFHGRFYKDDLNGKLKLINSEKDIHLIGNVIYLRSPITCACSENEVCHKCFGTTSIMNSDISDGISGFEIEEVTKVVNQSILSTKHLLTTISEKIIFNDEFHKFFTMIAGEITPIIKDSTVEDLDDWAIWLDPNSILKADEFDSDSSFNSYINSAFYVQNLVTKESILIQTEDEKEMFLSDDMIKMINKGKGYVKFKDITDDTTLFVLNIMNNELTKPLYQLMDLLNTNKKGDISYDEMLQEFVELLLSSKIDAMAISGELIINRLIRKDPDENYSRPNFALRDIGDYQIYTVLKALEHNKSLFIGLSSQEIKKQIISDDFVTKKTGTSYIDDFFRTEVSTDRLYEIHNLLENNIEED